MLHILGTIIIGFVAGVIAKLVTPGDNEPKGFILTTILGIVGAFVATYLGQAVGWYGPDQNAGFIGAIVGAVIILLVWGAYSEGTGNNVGTRCLRADSLLVAANADRSRQKQAPAASSRPVIKSVCFSSRFCPGQTLSDRWRTAG